MRKSLFVAAAAIAGALLTTAPAMAASTPVLTLGSTGGTAVAVGDSVSAGLVSGTKATIFTSATGTTGITCTVASFVASITSNPTAPGTADENVNTLSVSTCTSNIVGVTKVNSVTLQNEPYAATLSDSSDTITITGTSSAPIQSTVSLATVLGSVNCVYQANGDTLTGTASNTGNTISLSNQQFNLTSGPGVCPKNGFLTAKVGAVVDTTQGSQTVFVN